MILAIAAFVPISAVFDRSGTAGALADAVVGAIGNAGPHAVLAHFLLQHVRPEDAAE